MANVRGCNLPDDLLYDVENHIWYREVGDGTVKLGMTTVATAMAGQLVAFTPKKAGRGVEAGKSCATVESGKWVGTDAELVAIVNSHQLHHGPVPMRDAIDFIHTCIFSTIKAIKFSNLPQICGGPIELAVITTDRNFRWVRHKTWDTAVTQGE